MFKILEQIWELPWYKAAAITVMDDCIVFLKLWWLWAGLVIFIMLWNLIE